MPAAVVPALMAVAGSVGTAAITGTLATLSVSGLLASFGVSVALGLVSRALTSGSKGSSFDSSSNNIEQRGITRQVRQAITSRKIIYGECRVSGAIVRFESTDDNKYLHMVIALAGHEVEEIGEVWLDDYAITEDMIDPTTRVVNTGRYEDLVRIVKEKGDQTTANSFLVADTTATSTDVGYETAYIYIRFEYDRDTFPNGLPNVSAWVKGKKCLDTRDSVQKYTPNIALHTHDYILSSKYGFGANSGEINDDYTDASANKCDEFVTTTAKNFTPSAVSDADDTISLSDDLLYLQTGDKVVLLGTPPTGLSLSTDYYVIPYQRKKTDDTAVRFKLATSLDNAIAGTAIDITGTGTSFTVRKTAEPRYHGGGVLDSAVDNKTNIEDIISGMAGRAVYSGGFWKVRAGSYITPTVTLNEDHIIGGISIQTRVSRKDRYNTVKGTYISQINNGQATDYPAVKNSTYITNDNNEQIIKDLPLPFTNRPHTAQRIAKIELEKMRQEIAFTASFNLHAMQFIVGDTVMITNTKMGWSGKVFEITNWSLGIGTGENPAPVVNMSLRETATTVYDWANGEETAVDPAPNTNLPNPWVVPAPTGLTATPIEIPTAENDKTYKFILSWTPPSNIFVTNGGFYEIEFKQSAETEWGRSYRAEDSDTSVSVNQVRVGFKYDARIRAVNNLGVRSAYNTLLGFTVTSPSGATISLDYLMLTQAVTDYLEYNDITDTIDTITDFGGLTT